MPKFDKPDYVNNIWADGALEDDIQFPSESKYDTGWIQEKPPYEHENAINNKHDSYIAYINQAGIPEWDSETEYQNGKSYVQASDGRIYKCIQTNNNRNPATSGNGSYWELFEGNRQATTSNRGTTRYATNNEAALALVENAALTPANLLGGILGGSLLANEGYFEIPIVWQGSRRTGIIQWGTFNAQTDNTSAGGVYEGSDIITFPKRFPSACFVVGPFVNDVGGNGLQETAWNSGKNQSQATIRVSCRQANTSVSGTYVCLGF